MTDYMKYLFLALFVFFSAVHLIDCYRGKGKNSTRTKPFLVPLILCYYLFSVQEPNWLLIAALATSWLGDVLLMPGSKAFFLSGGLSFAVSHVFFILVYRSHVDLAAVRPLPVVFVALAYAALIVWAFSMLRRYLDPFMKFGMTFYLLINAAMNLFAFLQLLSCPCLGSALAYVGAILFIISDTVLFLARFHENKNLVPRHSFVIMFTYILAEFLITQGTLLLG